MATTFGNTFVKSFEVTTSLTTVFTVPSSVTTAVINFARAVNSGSVPVTFSLQVIVKGQTAADKFKAVIDKTLAVGESYPLPEIRAEELQEGDFIQAIADVTTEISISLGGTFKTS